MSSLDTPALVMERLTEIEEDLAVRQNELEEAAFAFFRCKRERERKRAELFLITEGTVAERTAFAESETAEMGVEFEASYEALKAVCRVLDTRASIGMSLLRSQGRA